jgi:thiol-disulfide isomerase/thioredoxin
MNRINKLNYLCLCVAVVTLFSCKNQKTRTGYEIFGNTKNIFTVDSSKVITAVLVDWKYDTLAISPIKEGKFHFTGSVSEPTKVAIEIKKMPVPLDIILENDVYKTTLDGSLGYTVGGKLNTIVYGYKKNTNYQEAEKLVFKSFWETPNPKNKEEKEKNKKDFFSKVKNSKKIKGNYQDRILEGNYSNLEKFLVLTDNNQWDKYNISTRISLLDQYKEGIEHMGYFKKMKTQYLYNLESENKRKSVSKGKPFKEVVETSLDDTKIKLSEVVAKNKYTLLEFWASWCGPCRAQFPHLKKAYAKYHKQGFEIYAVSIDQTRKAWLKALNKENVPWINVVTLKDFKSECIGTYGVAGIPASYLIANDGTIVALGMEVREEGLDKILEDLFK